MIQTKLLLIEYAAYNDPIAQDHKKMQAIRGIKELLMKIDFNAEVIPLEDPNKLNILLVSLKGEALTTDESKLINELIIDYK